MFAFVVTSLLPPPVHSQRNDDKQNDKHSHGSRNESWTGEGFRYTFQLHRGFETGRTARVVDMDDDRSDGEERRVVSIVGSYTQNVRLNVVEGAQRSAGSLNISEKDGNRVEWNKSASVAVKGTKSKMKQLGVIIKGTRITRI